MSGGGRPGRVSLLVRNLPLDCRPDDIRMKFERYGEIRDVYLPRDFYTGRLRGFGFIEFRDTRDAEDAMYEMDRRQIGGREISVVLSKENRKTPREMLRRDDSDRGDSRPRSRRSRSRSPRRSSRRRSYSRSPRPSSRRRSVTPAGRSTSRSPARAGQDDRSLSPADRRDSRSASPARARSLSPRPGSLQPNGEEAFPTRYVEGDPLGAGPSASSLPGEDCEPAA